VWTEEDVNTRILIVEDEGIVAEDVRIGLQRLGYEVTGVVASGEEALASVQAHPPDLVLMDIQLRGGMDGIATARIVRDKYHLPVVYLTAHSDAQTLSRATETEPYGFLLKPFEARDLRSTIQVALYKHGAERRIRESEERYRRLTQALTDYIVTFREAAGGAVETIHSPACEAVTGYTAEELAADPELMVAMVADADRAAVAEQVRRLRTGEKTHPLEYRIRRKDGTLRWVRTTPVPRANSTGSTLATDSLVQDITERKVIEQGLRLTQFSVDSAADGILWTDAGGKVLYANDAMCTMLGYAREDLLHLRMEDIDPHYQGEGWSTGWTELRARRTVQRESLLRTKAGTTVPADLRLNHVEFDGREYNCASVRDTSARRKADEEREELVRELREALARVKSLSGMLPICASCKKIRDDAGYWTQVEAYLMKFTDAHFSHGLCPECAAKLYPEIFGPPEP
jgi:PAS domain S-box-containing protein